MCDCRYTILAAEACILDIDVGSLSTGKMAYFVVMTDDLWMGFAEHGYASIAGQMLVGDGLILEIFDLSYLRLQFNG